MTSAPWFASIRHNGGSIGEVIKANIGVRAQRLFTIFALLVLILVIGLLHRCCRGHLCFRGR